jgi:hypothetical protein
MTRIGLVVAVLAASFSISGTASAATQTGSETFNLNPSGPSFNPPPPLPLVTVTATYDDSGTITVSETGGADDAGGFGAYGASHWPLFDLTLTGHQSSTAEAVDLGESYIGGEGMTRTGIDGTLAPQTTTSPDRSTITYVWSSPYLANQSYTFVDIFQDGNYPSSVGIAGTFYFGGSEPTIAGGFVPSAPVRFTVGDPLAAVDVSTQLNGVADGDVSFYGNPAPRITGYSAIGIPPGLSLNFNGQDGYFSGTFTRAGTYQSAVTVSAAYNDNQQTTTATESFVWVISKPRPSMPTDTFRSPLDLGARPAVVIDSGDGAAILGGLGPRSIHRCSLRCFGHLRWTTWNATQGIATGIQWQNDCRPACARGTYYPSSRVTIRVWRPNLQGIFTRMTIRLGRRSFTLHATESNGYWSWLL